MSEAKMTDTERLDYLLRKVGEGMDIFWLIGNYDGDDEDQYFAVARQSLDDGIEAEENNG